MLGSVYLKTTVNLQKCSNHSRSILGSVYLKSTVNLQKYSNHSCSILGSARNQQSSVLNPNQSWIVPTPIPLSSVLNPNQ